MRFSTLALALGSLMGLSACSTPEIKPQAVDLLISGSTVYTGETLEAKALDIAVCGEVICGVSPQGQQSYAAQRVINANGLVVSPGFIDAHTHSLEELLSQDKNANLNYLTQGVTTVVNGNDGGGPVDIAALSAQLHANGMGTNTALLVGHGSLRKQVVGLAERYATPEEVSQMKQLTEQAMQDGAIGLSSGLYYVPGVYANTQEVVDIAKSAAKYGGIYDTHLRDESTFNIGFTQAVDEAIDIATQADIHLHLAHLKALGVDVWGQSEAVIEKVERAQQQGVSISADQYPWQASGTHIRSAVVPKWVMADSIEAFHQRLNTPHLRDKISSEIAENIRRRGGADALLVTVAPDQSLQGKTLQQIADERLQSPVNTVIELVQGPKIRVASFNMSMQDIENFVVKSWVVTSSDGTNGHPRKFGSFPKKYRQFVQEKQLLTQAQFVYQSSTKTAQVLGLDKRGKLAIDYAADIVLFDPKNYRERASFTQWNELSSGVKYVVVNGELTIDNGLYTKKLVGKVVN